MNCQVAIGRRNQYFLAIVFIATGLTFYLFGGHEKNLQPGTIKFFKLEETFIVPGFLVYTPGCRIPEMDPFDKSVLKYLENVSAIRCSDKMPLVQSNQTSIWLDRSAFEDHNISDPSELKCCFSILERKIIDSNSTTTTSEIDDFIYFHDTCTSFEDSVNIYNEFIQVKCKMKNELIYMDFHAFIVPKEKNLSFTDADADAYDDDDDDDKHELSVLIIGADAMSRLNFHRKMPRTKDFLHSLSAIEFYGYNKVQDNTFPNLVPVLSGFSVDELKEFCWPKTSFYFDDCPWIWKNFSSKNFFTAFGEDANWMGLFNYLKRGFFRPPTDYYLRPYILANERLIGHTKGLNTMLCTGERFASEVLLDYAHKFTVNMTRSNKKFWGFFWETSLTHDFINVVPNNDDIFFRFFSSMKDSNVLNRTAVFFISDHGMRWGKIRETYQGRMEEHLPFLFVLLPHWFKEKYSAAVKNMERNVHLLTTHFDLHETLKDFLDLDNLKPENLKSRMLQGLSKRAMSLFLPVSVYRTCKSVGVKPTWCTCQRSKKLLLTDQNTRLAAKFIVGYLNKLLENKTECAQLELKNITSARVEFEEDIVKSDTANVFWDYVIIIVTSPGLAKFEATVRHRSGTEDLTLLGDISRINIYGSQSKCISDYRLKLYCFCI